MQLLPARPARPARPLTILAACAALLASSHSLVSAHAGPAAAVPAAPAAPEPAVRSEKVGEGAWCLFGRGGNVGVVATPSALLVVDTQYEPIAPEILAEIRRLSDAPIRFVVNTHFHADHTGGNAVFARQAPDAQIVGHENVRRRLYGGLEEWLRSFPGKIQAIEGILGGERRPGEAYGAALESLVGLLRRRLDEAKSFDASKVVAPAVGYASSLSLYPGGEEVVVFHIAPGHTDGDSIVWVPGRGVVHMGDLFWNGMYPFIDVDSGGGTKGWIESLDAILGRIPPGTRIIAGHGPVAGPSELGRFRAYLSDLRAAVESSRSSGRSLEEAVGSIRLEGYEDLRPGFMTLPQNVLQVWQELGGEL